MAICGNCKTEGVGVVHIRQCYGVDPAPEPTGQSRFSNTTPEDWEIAAAESDFPNEGDYSPAPAEDLRVNVNVPFSEKDEAKPYGVKWDRIEKTWYLPKGIPEGFPEKWLGEKVERKPVEEGFYEKDGEIFKVQIAVHGSGKPYAKRFVEDEGTTGWVISPGMALRLEEEDRIDLERAKELGHLYGICFRCGRTLTDESSIEAGIGPVCAAKF